MMMTSTAKVSVQNGDALSCEHADSDPHLDKAMARFVHKLNGIELVVLVMTSVFACLAEAVEKTTRGFEERGCPN